MTSLSSPATATTVPERRVPPLGGFSLTFLRLEIVRMLRNRRTLVFTLVMPPAFFLLFGGLSGVSRSCRDQPSARSTATDAPAAVLAIIEP